MSDLFYAIYSPSKDAWLDADGEYGSCSDAEHFREPDMIVTLEGDQRWVGPIAEGEYK